NFDRSRSDPNPNFRASQPRRLQPAIRCLYSYVAIPERAAPGEGALNVPGEGALNVPGEGALKMFSVPRDLLFVFASRVIHAEAAAIRNQLAPGSQRRPWAAIRCLCLVCRLERASLKAFSEA